MESEQLRTLTNKVTIRGTLAELEKKEGSTKNGVPYISLKGAIRFGKSGAETRRFRAFAQAQKSNGEDNQKYTDLKNWADSVVSEADNKDLANKFTLIGSLEAQDYINAANDLVETIDINAGYFNEYKETANTAKYPAIIDLEGYIRSIQDETKNNEETGRKKVTMITTDFFRNAVIVKDIIVPAELASDFTQLYSEGDTVTLWLAYMLHKEEAAPVSTGGLGQQRITEGKEYLEMVVTGAPPLDEENQLEKKVIKILMDERKQKLETLKEDGYQGKPSATSAPKKATSTKSKKVQPALDIDDDDIPF